MKPISTFGQTALRNANLRRLEGELAVANNELATGKKSDVAKSLGSGLINLQTVRNQFTANEAYLRSVDLFKQRYEMMDSAFNEVEAGIGELIQVATINGADALDSASGVPIVAESAIKRVISALNVSIGGRYLFGGAEVSNRPMQGLDDPAASGLTPRQVVQAAVAGTGPAAPLSSGVDQTAPATQADALDLLNRFDSIFEGGNFAAGAPLDDFSFENGFFNGEIGGALSEIRLPNNQYQSLSNDGLTQGLRDVLQGAYILASVDLNGITDEAAYRTVMTGDAGPPAVPGALTLITGGLSAIQDARANMGLQYQLVDSAEAGIRSQNALLNNEIVNLEGVDRAEVTTRLLNTENLLEASYQATGRVMNLSIWNYIR